MSRRSRVLVTLLTVLLILVAGGSLLAMDTGGDQLTGQRPDVIVVVADTLRARSLGVYGKQGNISPNIDRFAKDSIVFEEAITQDHWTLPAEMSIALSQYVDVHGIDTPGNYTLTNRTFLAERMADQGYHTLGQFVVWFGRGAYRHGYDTVRLEQRKQDGSFYDRTIASLQRHDAPVFSYMIKKRVHPQYGNGSTERIRDQVLSEYSGPLRVFSSLRGKEGVFGAGVLQRIRWNGTHTVLIEDSNGQTISDKRLDVLFSVNATEHPVVAERLNRINATHHRVVSRGDPLVLGPEDLQYVREQYLVGVRHFDWRFGRFIDELKQAGEYDDSIIILMSNHGENLANHVVDGGRLFAHSRAYEHTARVPLIMKLPDERSMRIEEPVELIDLQPTLLDLLTGSGSRPSFQGRSLVPLLRGRSSIRATSSRDRPASGTAHGSCSGTGGAGSCMTWTRIPVSRTT